MGYDAFSEKRAYNLDMFRGKIKILILVGLVCIKSCGGPRYLNTIAASPQEITGTYDLFLYGHRYADDFKNIAFLIPQRGQRVFELYAAEFEYTMKKGLPANTAIEEAEKFVKFHYSFQHSQLNKILDYKGIVVGYELKPIYSALDFPYGDVLDVHYIIKGDKVIASVGLKPEIEERPIGPFLLRPKVK
jgi:hypothetical protein